MGQENRRKGEIKKGKEARRGERDVKRRGEM